MIPLTVVWPLSVEPTFSVVTPAWVVSEAGGDSANSSVGTIRYEPTFSVVTPAWVVSEAVVIPLTVVWPLSADPAFSVVTPASVVFEEVVIPLIVV